MHLKSAKMQFKCRLTQINAKNVQNTVTACNWYALWSPTSSSVVNCYVSGACFDYDSIL